MKYFKPISIITILIHNVYKSSINDVSNILVFFIIIIITKIECWPVFKQDPPCLILLPWPRFLTAVQELKALPQKDVNAKVKDIWDEFLGHDASAPVNIDSKSMNTTRKNMEHPDRWTFDEAAVSAANFFIFFFIFFFYYYYYFFLFIIYYYFFF